MITIGSLIQASGRGVFSVAPTETVIDALRYMAEKNIGAVLVMDGQHLAGIFSNGTMRARWSCKDDRARPPSSGTSWSQS